MRQTENLKQQSDEELMKLLVIGSKGAFTEVYERYHSRMLNYFFRMLYRDEEKARDFTHDLFMKIIEKPGLFNSERKFSTWIYAVASNMCKNEYRSRAVRENGVGPIGWHTQEIENETMHHQLDLEKFKARLKDEMDQLNPQQKEAFVMRFQDEMPIKEIAEVMECSEGTIKSRLFYSLKKMSEKLKEFNPNR
ncbi:MAG: RNA polymerase sigma factor [Bacteroidales bacterium]|nr:RNA polymerase sigma factor [Bacteroidales bacterium]MCF8456167.1 RNA polymerase sigma factor [Bacteroidales bacterium]